MKAWISVSAAERGKEGLVVESSFYDLTDMRFKGEGGVQYHVMVACLGQRGDSSAVDGEIGVVGSAKGGLGANEEELSFVTIDFEEIE